MVSRLSPRALAILALVGANVIWGSTFVALKPVLDRVPPLTVASLRFAIALAILLPLVYLVGDRPARGRGPLLMGLTGVFLVYLCQNIGLQYSSAANGALIHGGIPILTALLAAAFLGERLGGRGLVGVLASLVGVAVIVLPGIELGLSALGHGLLLASALSIAAYLVIGRRAFPAGGSLATVAGAACYGFLMLLPATAVELAVGGMDRPTTGDLLRLLYLGAGASALAFVLWAYGLCHFEAGRAATFANLNPLVGVALAALLLGEPVTRLQLGGGALVLAGVWLAAHQPAAAPGSAGTLIGEGPTGAASVARAS
ncbi:MAG: DMT family transporter [Chloroflexota bacterium]|nr:DMT family transporter [Chloroflexota bacterium]